MKQGALTAGAAGKDLVSASEYRALEAHLCKLQRPLGEKAILDELPREAVSRAAGPKTGSPDWAL